MADVEFAWADGDGVRLVDGDGYYLLTGHTGPAEPPSIPRDVGYDPSTGLVTAAWQADASHHRIYSNDYSSEKREGLRDELVSDEALTLSTDTSYDDGTLEAGEVRVYDVCAYDELYDIEGPPSRPVFAHGDDHRLDG